MTDAGWMALSRDRGTAAQRVDEGYGVVCDFAGTGYPDLIVAGTSQEHGTLALRSGSPRALPDLAVGDKVYIQPNDVCAIGAQHERYQAASGSEAVVAERPRIRGR